MPPTYYRGCWHVVSRDLFLRYRPCSSPRKAVYNPKAFFPHAASLHQAFAHCAIFLTAAARRRRDRVSVPVWGATLSRPLPVVGLVGHYPTNYLIGRRPIPERRSFSPEGAYAGLSVVSNGYPPLWGRFLRVTHPSATQLPLPKQRHCVRLACVKHAASVHPEPGSNSLSESFSFLVSSASWIRLAVTTDPSVAQARYRSCFPPFSAQHRRLARPWDPFLPSLLL